jgi:hypothetical protein
VKNIRLEPRATSQLGSSDWCFMSWGQDQDLGTNIHKVNLTTRNLNLFLSPNVAGRHCLTFASPRTQSVHVLLLLVSWRPAFESSNTKVPSQLFKNVGSWCPICQVVLQVRGSDAPQIPNGFRPPAPSPRLQSGPKIGKLFQTNLVHQTSNISEYPAFYTLDQRIDHGSLQRIPPYP